MQETMVRFHPGSLTSRAARLTGRHLACNQEIGVRFPGGPLKCVMKSKTNNTNKTSLAASVAPEDLGIGDFVAVLNEIHEYPAIVWCDLGSGSADELIRVRTCATDGGTPLKIKAICLPFVYAKSPEGSTRTIDIRQVQLVRLKKRYSETIWNDLRKQRAKEKKKRNNN
jgi:hypothetical protein